MLHVILIPLEHITRFLNNWEAIAFSRMSHAGKKITNAVTKVRLPDRATITLTAHNYQYGAVRDLSQDSYFESAIRVKVDHVLRRNRYRQTDDLEEYREEVGNDAMPEANDTREELIYHPSLIMKCEEGYLYFELDFSREIMSNKDTDWLKSPEIRKCVDDLREGVPNSVGYWCLQYDHRYFTGGEIARELSSEAIDFLFKRRRTGGFLAEHSQDLLHFTGNTIRGEKVLQDHGQALVAVAEVRKRSNRVRWLPSWYRWALLLLHNGPINLPDMNRLRQHFVEIPKLFPKQLTNEFKVVTAKVSETEDCHAASLLLGGKGLLGDNWWTLPTSPLKFLCELNSKDADECDPIALGVAKIKSALEPNNEDFPNRTTPPDWRQLDAALKNPGRACVAGMLIYLSPQINLGPEFEADALVAAAVIYGIAQQTFTGKTPEKLHALWQLLFCTEPTITNQPGNWQLLQRLFPQESPRRLVIDRMATGNFQ